MRELFDIPDDVTYLNCAYMSPLAIPVLAAGEAGMRRKTQPWQIRPADFFDETERCRERVARLVNARAADVAVVPSVSYGITQAAANLPLARGERIVVLDEQFPSNVFPWRELARRQGGSVVTVPRPASGGWTQSVLDELESGTVRIAALPHCHWTDGALLDLTAIAECCRRRQVSLVLDVTQSLGALPLDFAEIQPAYLVCATYKWLLGPYSMAFVVAREDMQSGTPLDHSWIIRKNAEDFRGLVRYEEALQDGARRYDVGERANFALMPMAIAALDLVLAADPAAIQATLSAYTAQIEAEARQMGLTAASEPERAGHFLGIRFPRGLPADVLDVLGGRGIHVSARGDSLRVTPHLYNVEQDRQRFCQALRDIVAR